MSATNEDTAVLIIGHGSRNASSNQAFVEFVQAVKKLMPDCTVEYAYIELAEPGMQKMAEQLAGRCKRLVLAPLLLFDAGHALEDIPDLKKSLEERFPETEVLSTGALGVVSDMVALCVDHLQELLERVPEARHIVMVSRGSRYESARGDFQRLIAQVHGAMQSPQNSDQGQQPVHIHAAYLHGQEPEPEEALKKLLNQDLRAIVVQPYLIFPGRLIADLQELCVRIQSSRAGTEIKVGRSLWPHDRLVAAFIGKIKDALHTADGPHSAATTHVV